MEAARLRHSTIRPFVVWPAVAVLLLTASHNTLAAPVPKRSSISSEAFLSSQFSTYFKQRKYQQALAALDVLAAAHPDDPLILRYRALTLERLGRRAEAIATYRHILALRPNHVPTHLFLGLAYAKAGQRDAAAGQFRWVIDHSADDEYRHWAQAQLARLRQAGRKGHKKIVQKPYLVGKTTVAYDSNALLIPDEESLSSIKKRAGAFLGINLDVGYPVILQKDRRVDAIYIARGLLHERGTKEVDFTTQGLAVNAKQRRFVGKQSVIFGGRYDARVNFLMSDLFSVVHP